MDATFIQARITAIQTQIIAYEAATLALANDGIQSYDLDTGQTRQKVTKLDLQWIQSILNSLYNQLTIWELRLNGGGTIIGKPQW
jgi:hypothetical protein